MFKLFPPLSWAVEFLRYNICKLLDIPILFPDVSEDGSANSKVKELKFINSTEEFVKHWGFPFETHYLTTKDGYILALHRIPHPRFEQLRGNAKSRRPPVILWHGFLMCSEVWVCNSDPRDSLAFTLAEAGYDVWLGNTRGNRYSCKHTSLKFSDEKYWDFSIDEIARYDLPDTIDHILGVTGFEKVTYVGFSQGTAQGFASFSSNFELNQKVDLFIALAATTKPKGLENRTIHSLINSNPEVIYLLFGRKALLSSVVFWASVLPPQTFAWVIDVATHLLFDWTSEHMHDKSMVYRHLYSFSSVKIVVHWFQIIKENKFQMYDDRWTHLLSRNGPKVPHYALNQIKVNIID